MLIYDRDTLLLWSQTSGEANSGPLGGASLRQMTDIERLTKAG